MYKTLTPEQIIGYLRMLSQDLAINSNNLYDGDFDRSDMADVLSEFSEDVEEVASQLSKILNVKGEI